MLFVRIRLHARGMDKSRGTTEICNFAIGCGIGTASGTLATTTGHTSCLERRSVAATDTHAIVDHYYDLPQFTTKKKLVHVFYQHRHRSILAT